MYDVEESDPPAKKLMKKKQEVSEYTAANAGRKQLME